MTEEKSNFWKRVPLLNLILVAMLLYLQFLNYFTYKEYMRKLAQTDAELRRVEHQNEVLREACR